MREPARRKKRESAQDSVHRQRAYLQGFNIFDWELNAVDPYSLAGAAAHIDRFEMFELPDNRLCLSGQNENENLLDFASGVVRDPDIGSGVA